MTLTFAEKLRLYQQELEKIGTMHGTLVPKLAGKLPPAPTELSPGQDDEEDSETSLGCNDEEDGEWDPSVDDE